MSDIAVQGICYDEKSSYLRGPALAPPLIRRQFFSPANNLWAETGLEIAATTFHDKGDFSIAAYADITEITARHLREHPRLLTLGGDHSITFPILKAYHEVYPDLAILQLDAHGDLYEEFEGDRYSHACPFARIMEAQYAARLVQLGIRTLNDHQRQQAAKYHVEIHEMKNFDPKALPTFERPLYISLDLDALDPAYAPGVAHHEPGGFTTREVLHILQSIRTPIVGADVVEYNPHRDVHDITATVAAKCMKELLAKMIENG